MTIWARGGDLRYVQIVDHPAVVLAGPVVDNEQSGNIGEDVDKRSRVSGIGRKAGLGLQHDTNGAEGRPQLAPVTVNCAVSLIPGMSVVKTLGSKPVVSSR